MAAFALFASVAAQACGAEAIDGPVPDSVPAPPPEPTVDLGRLTAFFSRESGCAFDLRREMAGRTPWLTNRISRCFFGPIKRPPHNRDELMDDVDYYPDGYLDTLAREGVNGLWITISFADFSKELTGGWPEGAERRLAKLRQTVEKCAKHGIKVWLFCIEPVEQDFRKSPLALKHPDWIGCTYDDLMGTMCASHPGVAKYIEDVVRDVFSAVPGLGGIINISHGEMVTSCLSMAPDVTWFSENRFLCPRCRDVPFAELHHRVVRPMVRGMRAAGSDGVVVSWVYRHPKPELPAWVAEAAATAPDGVIEQSNFEDGSFLFQEGAWRLGSDYWISCPGPSAAFARVAERACAAGRRVSAKIQVSCSHEIATIPVLPVPGLLYRKFRAMRALGVTDAMYCWYFGAAPGIMNRAAGMLAFDDFSDGEDAFLLRLAELEWKDDAPRMAKVWKACSDGFANYPLSNKVQYYGPYHQGVAWPLRAEIEMRPMNDSWIPHQPACGDMVGECLMEFSLQDALSLAKKMAAAVDEVEEDIAFLERKYAGDRERMLDLGLVRALQCHFAAGRDFFEFYHARRDAICLSRAGDTSAALAAVARMKSAVSRQVPVSERMARLCREDPRLGYHSEAEAYLYWPELLKWRVETLRRTAVRIREIEDEIRAGRGYPLSPLEKAAPVFAASLDDEGALVVEGEAKGDGPVTLWLYDLCGTEWVRRIDLKPKDRRFSLRLQSAEWNGDPRLCPKWIQIHQDCSHLGDSWQWPAHPPFKWRWHHRDVLGFYSARLDTTPVQ